MVRVLGRYSPYIYALLRIVAGFLFFLHGTQILFGVPAAAQAIPSTAIITVAGVIELVTGLLIMLGLFASYAAFIASGTMAVAYFMVHQPMGGWPIQNMGEPAALNAFIFLYIASRGSGVWSIDSALRGTTDGT
jgi:putative oxidoreductase